MFADLFDDVGRRSVPPMIVAVVMVLQRIEGCSDREAVDYLCSLAGVDGTVGESSGSLELARCCRHGFSNSGERMPPTGHMGDTAGDRLGLLEVTSCG